MANRYIAFLRGINVGGRTVKMERLRRIFSELGFANVRSYINSGNLFFDTEEKGRPSLAERIERKLLDELGYEVPVFLRTIPDLERVLTRDPFKDVEPGEDKRFCVLFTDVPLNEKLDLPLYSSKNDMQIVDVDRHEAYVVWHLMNGRPPSGRFPKGVLPSRNTTRFFHTLKKILQAAQKE